MIHARALYRLKATLIYIYIYTSFCIVLGYIPSKQKQNIERQEKSRRSIAQWKFQLEATCSANKTYFLARGGQKIDSLQYIYILKTVVAQPLEHCFGNLYQLLRKRVRTLACQGWLPALTAVVDFSFLAYFGWLNIL